MEALLEVARRDGMVVVVVVVDGFEVWVVDRVGKEGRWWMGSRQMILERERGLR